MELSVKDFCGKTAAPLRAALNFHKEGSFKNEVVARFLFVVQSICSLVAAPFLFLFGIFSTTSILRSEEADKKEKAWVEAKNTGIAVFASLLGSPAFLLSAIDPRFSKPWAP